MTITVTRNAKEFNLGVDDILQGNAYEDEAGRIFIGNFCGNYSAFSVCGNYYLRDTDENTRLREVDLEIIVK